MRRRLLLVQGICLQSVFLKSLTATLTLVPTPIRPSGPMVVCVRQYSEIIKDSDHCCVDER